MLLRVKTSLTNYYYLYFKEEILWYEEMVKEDDIFIRNE